MCDILWPYEVSDGIEDRQPDFGGVLLYGEGRCLAVGKLGLDEVRRGYSPEIKNGIEDSRQSLPISRRRLRLRLIFYCPAPRARLEVHFCRAATPA